MIIQHVEIYLHLCQQTTSLCAINYDFVDIHHIVVFICDIVMPIYGRVFRMRLGKPRIPDPALLMCHYVDYFHPLLWH